MFLGDPSISMEVKVEDIVTTSERCVEVNKEHPNEKSKDY